MVNYRDLTDADLADLVDELRHRTVEADGPWVPPTPLVEWYDAYGLTEEPVHWLIDPLLPEGASTAIFAKGGTGKSLLALWLAAGLATGQGLTGPVDPVDVLYLDYEMTVRDVVARLEDMGYTDPAALKGLRYASLPTLPALDTPQGGATLLAFARHLGVGLVVIDTFGRAVDGEEDKADTVRAWYRWTGRPLKEAGIPYIRVDHAGKDLKQGQRGSSAKNDDVDVVWEMTDQGGGEFMLRSTKRRVSWVPESVRLRHTEDNGVLAYRWDDRPAEITAEALLVAQLLDELGAPTDLSRRKAIELLKGEGVGRQTRVVADAVRYRKASGTIVGNHENAPFTDPFGTKDGTHPEPQGTTGENHSEPLFGPTGGGGVGYVVAPPSPGLGFDDDEPLF